VPVKERLQRRTISTIHGEPKRVALHGDVPVRAYDRARAVAPACLISPDKAHGYEGRLAPRVSSFPRVRRAIVTRWVGRVSDAIGPPIGFRAHLRSSRPPLAVPQFVASRADGPYSAMTTRRSLVPECQRRDGRRPILVDVRESTSSVPAVLSFLGLSDRRHGTCHKNREKCHKRGVCSVRAEP
jgi:hypothetical protein